MCPTARRFSTDRQFFRRNPDGFQGKPVPPRGKKNRCPGMSFYKLAQNLQFILSTGEYPRKERRA